MPTTIEKVHQAVKYLAGMCDGANSLDGCGFNKVDARFGRDLAERTSLTPGQAEAAQRMLRKYKGQLINGGGFDEKILSEPITLPEKAVTKKGASTAAKKASVAEGDRIKIEFPFNYDTLEVVKSIPGRRFHGDANPKHWTAPISGDAVEILSKAGFQLDPELEEILNRGRVSIDEVKEVDVPGLKKELFPFQKKGVAFIEAKNGRALIGDEMGLGKTIQALAWLQLHPEKRPAIILCPASLKLNWAREVRETLPGKQNIQVLQGTKLHTITGDIVIINYDILNAWLEKLQALKPQVLIFDEAHYIKNNSAQRTKATKKLAKKIPHVIALTGTPIVNRPVEGFNIIQTIDKTVFPNWWDFVHRYCGAKHNGFGWDFSGATNKEELHKKLTETVMIRRKKADVLPDLPDKLYSYIPMEMNNRDEYDRAERDFVKYLKQVKGDEAAEKARQAEHLVKIEGLKQLAVKGKMKHAVQWIRDFLDTNGNKLVVFAVHKAVVDALMEEFKEEAVKVDGSVSAAGRDAAVKAFQEDPKVKLFVGNIQAAGVGLTLTASSSVAFLELPWTPGELVQAEDRCHRIGQKDSVNVYYLLADGTIEEKIAQLLDEKRQVLNAVLDGKEVEETQLLSELIKSYQKGE
jgi:SWI/SNF-related matrix-associated actin-dependent regulator 1 of chromatin subfamily A